MRTLRSPPALTSVGHRPFPGRGAGRGAGAGAGRLPRRARTAAATCVHGPGASRRPTGKAEQRRAPRHPCTPAPLHPSEKPQCASPFACARWLRGDERRRRKAERPQGGSRPGASALSACPPSARRAPVQPQQQRLPAVRPGIAAHVSLSPPRTLVCRWVSDVGRTKRSLLGCVFKTHVFHFNLSC